MRFSKKFLGISLFLAVVFFITYAFKMGDVSDKIPSHQNFSARWVESSGKGTVFPACASSPPSGGSPPPSQGSTLDGVIVCASGDNFWSQLAENSTLAQLQASFLAAANGHAFGYCNSGGCVCSNGVTLLFNNCPSPLPPGPVGGGNNAQCLFDISAPSVVVPGQTFEARVTMGNTGNNSWTSGGGNPYVLRSADPNGNMRWGVNMINLPFAPINRNQSATFVFNATAPSTSGTHQFNWQMFQVNVGGFGSRCMKEILVGYAPDLVVDSSAISPVSPNAGDRVTLSGVIKNIGTADSLATQARLRIDVGSNGWDMTAYAPIAPLSPGSAWPVAWNNIWLATRGGHRYDICANRPIASTFAEADFSQDSNCVRNALVVGSPECNDGIDNADPEDVAAPLQDAGDPGCHTDGDASNSSTYDPADDDETDSAISLPAASFTASPSFVFEGQSPNLQWSCANSIRGSIDQGVGQVCDGVAPCAFGGKRAINPANTTIYALTCVGLDGVAIDRAEVTVQVGKIIEIR